MADRSVRTVFEFVTRASTGGVSAVRDELEQITEATDDLGNEAKDASTRTGQAEGVLGKLGRTAKIAKVAIAGAAVALASLAIGTAVRDFIAVDEAMAQFQAQTGITNEELGEYRDIAQEVFNMGLGDSFDEVAGAMALVRNVTNLQGDALQETTRRALIFAETFDRDVTESIRAAQNMANVWGNDAAENFDILAGLMQETGDPANDLLDTFNEYASTFESLGFDILEFGAILDTGLEAGAFNTDVIADSVREFGIRLRDGTSEAAILALGLDDLYAGFQTGEVQGAEMFTAILDGLREIEDPIARNAAGVEIFGTKWEDMGEDVFLALDPAISETYELGSAINDADAALSQSVSRTWTRFTRTLRTTLTNALGPFIQKGLNIIIPLLEKLTKNSPEIVALGAAFVALGVAIPIISSLAGVFSVLLGPVGLVLIAVTALGAAFATNFLGIRDVLGDVLGGVKQLYEELKTAFQEGGLPQLLSTLWDRLKEGVINAAEWVDDKIVEPIETYINEVGWDGVQSDLEELLEKFLGVAASAITSVTVWVWTNILSPIVSYLQNVNWSNTINRLADLMDKFLGLAASVLTTIGVWVWDNIVEPIVSYLQNVNWSNTISRLADLLEKFLGVAASVLTSIGVWVWDNIVSPVITYLANVDWATVGSKLVTLLEKLLGVVGAGIVSVGQWAYDNIIQPIVDKLGSEDTWTTLFDAAVETGSKIFEGIVNALSGLAEAILNLILGGVPSEIDLGPFGKWKTPGHGAAIRATEMEGGVGPNPNPTQLEHEGRPGSDLPGPLKDVWDFFTGADDGATVGAGTPVLIGRGAQPELFIPDNPGTFYPRGQYSLVTASAGGGGDEIHNWAGANFNLYGVQDIEGLYRQLENLRKRKNI